MKLEEKLCSMLNKTWMYKTRNHKLLSFKIKTDDVIIVTDKEWIEVPLKNINQILAGFLPVDDEVRSEVSLVIFKGNGKPSLKDLIYENIENIKKDPEYIKTAKALNEQIKTVIEMAKLEIQLSKLG